MALTANLCTNAQQRQQVTQSEILIIAQRLLADSSEQSERTIQNIQVAEKREVEELTLHLIERLVVKLQALCKRLKYRLSTVVMWCFNCADFVCSFKIFRHIWLLCILR